MAISITVDNNRLTVPFDPLLLDESAGVQTPVTTDDGNEINVTLTAEVGGLLGGFPTAFNTFLNGGPLALTDAQKIYARDHDGALSASDFVLVTTTAGETINDLFFANSTGGVLVGVQVVGMTTLDGQNVYLWSNGNFGSSGDFCVATTSNVAGDGEVVAAFYLNEAADHKSAQILMVVFEPLEHNNDGVDPDDALNFTDALRVGATGTLAFDFDQLASSSNLWVAVGNSSEGVLVTGLNPDVDNTTGKKTNDSDNIFSSQGGAGATIGLNNQLLDNLGETAVFTLVTGMDSLVGNDAGVLSDYAIDSGAAAGIDYGGYIPNVTGAGVFISQDQGNPNATKSLDINVFATNNATPEEGFGYVYSDGVTKTGDALGDDTPVNVATVTVRDQNGAIVATWVAGADPDGAGPLRGSGATVGGVTVTIAGNNIDVNNFGVQYTISWTTNTAFNRFHVVNEEGKWDIGRVDVDRTIPINTPVGDKLFVEDDFPTLTGNPASKRVEEDELSVAAADGDLSTGITDGDGSTDEVNFTNADLQLVVNAGTDAPATFSLNLSVSGAVKDIDGNAMTSKGDAMTWNVNGSVIEAVAGGRVVFTITQTAGAGTPNDPTDDVFRVDLRDQIDHPDASGDGGIETLDLTPAFSAKDADNDPVDLNGAGNDQETIQLVVENDVPALSGTSASKRVEEDELSVAAADGDLSTGITDGDAFTDEVNFSNADLQLTVNAGADEPVTFDLDLDGSINGTAVKDIDGNSMTSKGDAMTWNVNGSVIEAKAGGRVVFTVTQTAGGATADPADDVFRVDLRDQIDHPDASGDGGIETLDLTPAFVAEDFDGDVVDLNGAGNDQETIQLVVENDVPIVSGTISRRVEEDELSVAAADGDLSTGITDGDAFTDEVNFTNADLQTAVTPGADEPVSFDLNTSVSGAVKDIDGNAMTSKGDAMTWNVNGSVIEAVAGGRVVFTIEQTAGGATADPADDVFRVDLRDQIDHPDASTDTGIETLDLTPAFVAEDFDGDAVDLNGAGNDQEAIQLVVENDVPTAKPNTVASEEVHEDALTGGNLDVGDLETKVVTVTYTQLELAALANIGADEDLTFSLNTAASGQPGAVIGTNVVTTGGAAVLSKGLNVVWAAGDTPGSLKGVVGGTTIFTLTPSGDDFDFTLVDQVDHSGAESDTELLPIDLTSAFKAVDFDNDPMTLNPDSVVLNVENDLPIFDAQIISQTLDWIDDTFVTGSLHGKVGGDEPASYVIDKYTDLAGYVETLSGDGKTLTYSIGGTTFFTLALNDAANSGAGGYTFTVNEPPPNQPLELDFEDLDSGQNLFGTVAFDKTNVVGGVLPDGGLLTFATNLDINDGEDGEPGPPPVESTDGTMTSESGTTNTSKGGGPVTIGNTNQAFDQPGEGAWFVYVDNPAATAVSGVGLDANLADDADNIKFDGTIEVFKAGVEIVQASGAGTAKRPGPAMLITAYDIDPQTVGDPLVAGVETGSREFALDPSATGAQSNIIGVKIYNENGVLIEYRTNEDNGATNDGDLEDIPGNTDDSAVLIQFNLDDNGGTPADPTDDIYSILVSNLKANYTIEWETEEGHDAAKVERVSGSYDIGGFDLLQGQPSADVDFEFSVAIQDKDGDLIHFNAPDQVFDDFKIKVDGTGPNNDPLNIAPSPFLTSYDLV